MNDNDLKNQNDNSETQNTMNRIYTVGHSNQEIGKFIKILMKHNITEQTNAVQSPMHLVSAEDNRQSFVASGANKQ